MHFSELLQRASRTIASASALLVCAGAGMGVDSGLPDFRGTEGFWRAYPPLASLGLSFESIANPRWFRTDPALAWGFYGHRLELYRRTVPHAGFALVKDWMTSKPHGGFVYTSNVDGQFQRAGFDDNEIVEIHGTIHQCQCLSRCGVGIFPSEGFRIQVDETSLRASEPLPDCPECGSIARPNILMFGDGEWNAERTDKQCRRLQQWLSAIPVGELVVIELGAGITLPHVRQQSERWAHRFQTPLIRINPVDASVPTASIGLPYRALETLQSIHSLLFAL
jgi:NAD-dependent SIR2 family protein deacetylase